MISLLRFFLTLLVSPLKSKSRLEAENAALRHQLIILRRKARGRVRLAKTITISRPETLVRWHCAGFRRYDLRSEFQACDDRDCAESASVEPEFFCCRRRSCVYLERRLLLSELRKVTWHHPLELGEVARNRRDVESSEDGFLWLAVEQEPEGRLETALRRVLARRQPLAHLSRHRDVVTSLALSL